MNLSARFAIWVGVVYVGLALIVVAMFLLVISGTEEPARDVLWASLERHAPLVAFLALLLFFGCLGVVRWLFSRYVLAARALADQTRIVATANPEHRVATDGASELVELAGAINRLGDEARRRQAEFSNRVAEAVANLGEERNRLAALMSELTQGVLVCNADGRILLYNEQVVRLFTPRSDAMPQGGLVGLGRSIFGLLDRDQLAHAMDKVHAMHSANARSPHTRFLTTLSNGAFVRVQLAPFRSGDGEIAGMVMTLDDVTGPFGQEAMRRSLLQALAMQVRQPAAGIRAAAENLVAYPEMDEPHRTQFAQIIADESMRLSASIDGALADYADALKTGLALEEIAVANFLVIARRRIEAAHGVSLETADVDENVWINVDSFALVQTLEAVVARLHDEFGIASLRLDAGVEGGFARIDLSWRGAATDVIEQWEALPILHGNEQSALTLRDVLDRHGGAMWSAVDSEDAGGTSRFRFLLPLADVRSIEPHRRPLTDSRPEYYDFDLFRASGAAALGDRELAELDYTVFDTETTGLEPSAGDEIISIGAVRIVNGRLRKNEIYEQLVDPQRPISTVSTRVHGLRSGDVVGQPTISDVLPVFHRFCEDTVLVAHNGAFDMRFLELKERATGVRFTQPVLDTLLLSAVVNPNLPDHRIEAIAERLGLAAIGRHTALGDALMTAEVFLKLVPLLAERGLVTLTQVLEASRESYYARLRY